MSCAQSLGGYVAPRALCQNHRSHAYALRGRGVDGPIVRLPGCYQPLKCCKSAFMNRSLPYSPLVAILIQLLFEKCPGCVRHK